MHADPIGAVEQLYRDLGDELTDDARERMAAWWESSAAARATGPRPDPAEYGLNLDALRERFAFYHRRFGIPVG